MRLEDFDYELAQGRIAQTPAERRDASRLLVHGRASGATQHRAFRDLPEHLPAGALVVLNDTRVLPPRLGRANPTGGPAELLCWARPPPPGGPRGGLARPSNP